MHPHSDGLYCVPGAHGIGIHPCPGTYCSNFSGTPKMGRESHDPSPADIGGQGSVHEDSVIHPTYGLYLFPSGQHIPYDFPKIHFQNARQFWTWSIA